MTQGAFSRARLTLVAGAAILCFTAAPAFSQMLCAERSGLVKRLAEHHKETPIGGGLTAQGRVLEVYTAPTGSFTVVITLPDGRACIAAVGESWQAKEPEPVGTKL